MSKLTHFEKGKPRMVDVSHKEPTVRTATAEACVKLTKEAVKTLRNGTTRKGDPLTVAQLAGIMAAKKTSDLIPLCHPIPISNASVELEFLPEKALIKITSTVRTKSETGVEMEALTAAAVAALTVYDMLKAVSKGLEVSHVRLLSKTGGKSGDWLRKGFAAPR
ncbi:MAG: cyclic pyranopterin monophosphate synthase MoaC [Deinococcus sp.]|nr:cyclic pyranopterin monophosphate synthase MoaC [Deinococcus sp.]